MSWELICPVVIPSVRVDIGCLFKLTTIKVIPKYRGPAEIFYGPIVLTQISCTINDRRVAAFNAGEPGFGLSACNYMAEKKIILWGGDTWGTEAVGPGFAGENEQPFECHIKMMTKRGIWNIENLDFSQLLADNVSEFLFVWSPLKMKGGTGSPGNPVALY